MNRALQRAIQEIQAEDSEQANKEMTDRRRGWSFGKEEKTYTVLPSDQNPFDNLPPGAYEPGFGMFGPFAQAIELKDEELIAFDEGPCQEILQEINHFWTIQDRYDKLGIPYRRGILMHGVPGTGKSGIIRLVCDEIIDQNGLILIVKTPGTFTKWLPTLNRMEPDRNVVVVLEDIDELYEYDEQEFLQMLDGIGNDRPGLLYLATTNFLDHVPSRIYRPSRFDLLIEIKPPSVEIRTQYVHSLCERYEVAYRDDIVRLSDGLSFAHLKEVLVSCLLYDRNIDTMIQRMKDHCDEDIED